MFLQQSRLRTGETADAFASRARTDIDAGAAATGLCSLSDELLTLFLPSWRGFHQTLGDATGRHIVLRQAGALPFDATQGRQPAGCTKHSGTDGVGENEWKTEKTRLSMVKL